MRPRAQPAPAPTQASQPSQHVLHPCFVCDTINARKLSIACAVCHRQAHLTCVGLTRAQSDTLPIWNCADCLRPTLLAGPVVEPSSTQVPTPTDLAASLANLKTRTRVPKFIPRRKRHQVASELADLIFNAVEHNTATAWWRLLSYAFLVLGTPSDSPSLSTPGPTRPHSIETNHPTPNADSLARLISSKCSDGDIRGALRLLTTPDTIAPPDAATIEELKGKHPQAPADEDLQPFLRDAAQANPLLFPEAEVLAAIQSMPRGSSAGLDGIRPLHLQQLTSKNTAEAGTRLLSALTALCHHAASGNIPEPARNAFFGASLIAIKKKLGGLRPIAIGSSFRRLTSKLVAKSITASIAGELQPTQLGVGVPLGCEAAVHAVRKFTHSERGRGEVLVKVDLSNAFNSVSREAVLSQVSRRCPSALPLVSQAYAQPTPLFIAGSVIWSCRGVQQGDPLGPLLFSLAIDPAIQHLRSPINIWYLDDGTLAGPADTVSDDIASLTTALERIGLSLNSQKSEIYGLEDAATPDLLLPTLPDARTLPLQSLSLLGAPIHAAGLADALTDSFRSSERMIDRVEAISSHQAFSSSLVFQLFPAALTSCAQPLPTWPPKISAVSMILCARQSPTPATSTSPTKAGPKRHCPLA